MEVRVDEIIKDLNARIENRHLQFEGIKTLIKSAVEQVILELGNCPIADAPSPVQSKLAIALSNLQQLNNKINDESNFRGAPAEIEQIFQKRKGTLFKRGGRRRTRK
jgi:hypothetical protein